MVGWSQETSGIGYITRSEDYAGVYSRGKAWVNDLLVMKALFTGQTETRCGFSISKRVGKAVVRNRVKRRLREILRQTPLKKGWDIVFIARPAIASTNYAQIQKAVENLLSRANILGETCLAHADC